MYHSEYQSTRLRGLVDRANEVALSLLSSSEAIQMLCGMADISIDAGVPAEVVPIVNLVVITIRV